MKILTGIDIPFIPFGGSPIICNDLYSNLPSHIQVRFLTLPPNNKKYLHWWTIEDVTFLDIEKKKTIEEFPEYIEKLKEQLQKEIEQYQPDIIHCQHMNFGFSRAISELTLSIPKIGICHGTDVQIARTSSYFLNNMQKIREKMNLLIFPAKKMADDYFSIDRCQKDYIIIPHGIPEEAFIKKPLMKNYNFSKKPLQLLYAGRLTSYKGADIIASAMKLLKQYNIHLTIIGDEDQQSYKNKIQNIISQNQLQNITLQNQVSRHDLWKIMAKFDLMVFPSTIFEAFSLTAVEAQAHGLPVMYTRAGGIEDAVAESGIVVPINTPTSWATKILDIYNSPKILLTFQKRGLTNAQKYRITQMRKKYYEISQQLIV